MGQEEVGSLASAEEIRKELAEHYGNMADGLGGDVNRQTNSSSSYKRTHSDVHDKLRACLYAQVLMAVLG